MNFAALPCRPAQFYLPREDVDYGAFAVIACDQYTAQKDQWEKMDRLVGKNPSALRMIIPEAYLDESETRVPRVQQAMREYLDAGILRPAVKNGMVLTARSTSSGTRLGLVMTVDLEQYSFEKDAKALIRPTEGTIVERIPPRLRVRRGAALEMSHILLLCDDPGKTVVEPLYAGRGKLRPLYDVSLMLDGGRVQGWAVEDEAALSRVADALTALKEQLPPDGFLFAVGDGNHSLATARAYWLEIRETLTPSERENHPARFAMAELNNLYDPALHFEPIHRVLFGVTGDDALRALSPANPVNDAENPDVRLVTRRGDLPLRLTRPLHALPVGTVQACLDRCPGMRMDYVHGEDTVRLLVEKENAVGLLLPAMDKSALFPAVLSSGVLPRKTFSMGEACEKRYYLEARKITED